MKSIMYHYVRPAPVELPYFRYLDLNEFRQQLDFFSSTDRFLALDEFLTALETGEPVRQGLVLTFDDGLADHYRYVFPELKRRGLWGIFYVPTGMYLSGKLLDVHRTHYLLGRYGGVRVLEALNEILGPEMLSHEHVEEFQTLTYIRQDNDEATTRFKRILNYFISDDWREKVLDELVWHRFGDGCGLVETFYMSPAELRKMHDAGMVIGSHSVTHSVLSKLEPIRQAYEIRESFAFLEDAVGSLRVRTFCHPYGGFHSFTPMTERLLNQHGCRFAFNVEPRDINRLDLRKRPQALPRYDCNMFPHGKAHPPRSAA
jgi:peptidoglycan/xylan/chitin deacetylase (PgdA/CDA1 family)